MKIENKNKETPSTDISKHKREGSVLKPPFRQLTGMTPSSWKDDRLPEMLWAVLLIGNLKRKEALDIFHKVGVFISTRKELSDVTHSGMASWVKEARLDFIKLLKDSHPDSGKILQSLVIFPQIPGYDEWSSVLVEPDKGKELTDYLANGVRLTLWHQSQEATDCRWIKFLCQIHGGKMKFSSSISDIDETLRGIFEYPNYGDLTRIRPFIRASEIVPDLQNDGKLGEWPNNFWRACLGSTLCVPLPREEQRKDKIRISHDQVNRIRHLLLLHYLKTDKSTAIESKHDAIFGFGFYALRLVDELVATNLSRGAIGRLTLRSCVECYITLSYLMKKGEQGVWDDFREYGIGKMKLSYLKTRDLENKPAFIDEEFLKRIVNEDKWEEFSDIELSHWANSDLRKMSEEAGCKDIYDAYYDWTSSFSHSNWGAIRESSFAMCVNPLHRLHLIPSVIIYPLPGVLEDVIKITNLILKLINSQYSDLNCEIVNEPKPEKVSWLRNLYLRIRYYKMHRFLGLITGKK